MQVNLNKPVFTVFKSAKKDIEEKRCPFCKNVVNESDFKDSLSKKEYCISGLCQKCQDQVFGKIKE